MSRTKKKYVVKKYWLLLAFIALLNNAKATTQEYLDSVEQKLNTTSNKLEKLNCLYTLSFEYGLIDPQKGIEYGKQCLALAIKEKNQDYQLHACNGIANGFETMADFDSAVYYHKKSYRTALKTKVPQKIALTLFNVGLCYKQLGYYKTALNNYLTAYRVFEKDSAYNPRIHFYLGELYLRMENYEEAEYHSRLGISKCLQFNQDYVIYNMQINLAKCLAHRGQPDSAINLLNTTLVGVEKNTDVWIAGVCYNALGEIYLKKKEFENAAASFTHELIHQQKLKNENGILMAYLNLAFTAAQANWSHTGSFKENKAVVNSYLQKFEYQLSTIKKNNDILLEAYPKAAETHELMHQPEKALEYYKRYYALRDSILNKEKLLELEELQTRYETEKKERQIKELEQADLIKTLQLKSQGAEIKKRNIFIALCLFLMAGIGLFAYFYYNKQKLKVSFEKEMAIRATQEKERLRLAKDIHDDLGSGLSKINFLSELIIREKSLDRNASECIESIAETSRNLVGNMRDLIWALTPENNTLSDLIARIREYSTDYLEDFSTELILTIGENIPSTPITKESHREILMIVKESLNNIVKHSKANRVEIEIAVHASRLTISVKDNGVGITLIHSNGNGIKNMKVRIESIGGMFNLESPDQKGTCMTADIPIENIVAA